VHPHPTCITPISNAWNSNFNEVLTGGEILWQYFGRAADFRENTLVVTCMWHRWWQSCQW
jgi:hypothetical protein